ncbi:MAG: sigma-70 family RNA polymerase sigma factor [Ignavibacteria bacterium]|nr:sigma-70 family RNA polymerase sigma factor [Ignavibacteria bacterium]MBK8380864.1 sigma-70 family RNA polymerase sigma factor [Ignavibacteria bacterium]MBK9405777.1 sigma-70 family RNA polymerase sigma factor [Ignavibacteria bacterium]
MSSTSDNITKKEKDSSVINSVEEDISEENEFDLESDEFSAEEQQALSDEELKQKKIDFDLEAMPHMNLLHNYAYKMTFNQLDADDLLQETFLRAFRFFHKFEKGTNCKAWLFRIMKNLFINRYRKNQKEPGKVDYGEIENFFDTIRSEKMESSDLQQKVFSNLLDDDVTKALNSLQDDFKTVVILCDLEGLSYEEIADFVQCPIGTVRSRLHRGRKMLQEKLYEYAKVRGYDVENNLIK